MTALPDDPAAGSSVERSSPYQGLVPFGEADEEWFFGREEWCEIVLDTIRAYRASVLYGASGVGKSSLLRASVLSRLRASTTVEGVPDAAAVVFAEWSLADPLAGLKEALRSAVSEAVPGGVDTEGDVPLAAALAAACERLGGAVYLVFDQFEELFLYHGSDDAGAAFEDELAGALRRRDIAANVLVAIREDSLAKLDRLQGRLPGLLDNLLRLEHLDRQAARMAIELPLEHWNRRRDDAVTIEPALVEAVLTEVETGRFHVSGTEAAGRVSTGGGTARIEAPYLQLVLSRLWNEESRADSKTLRLDTLVRLGGAETIVRTHLDEVLATLSRRDRAVASRAFRYLVTPSGTKIAHKPRDLASYADVDEARLEHVLATLAGEARILRPVADGGYEIYHDVLAGAVLDWRRRYEQERSQGALAHAIVLGAAAAITAIVMVAYLGALLDRLEAHTIDARFAIRGAHPPNDVAVVAIDDKTFNNLHVRWPFPRSLHGRVIDRLRADGARAIAYDIQFTEPTSAKEDNALAMAVLRAQNVALATTEVDSKGGTQIFGGNVRQLHARSGHALLAGGSDGVIKRLPWGTAAGKLGKPLESLALVAAEIATRHRIPPRDLRHPTPIDFAGPPGTIRTYSFSDVLAGRVAPAAFRGKVVVVGPSAPALQDIHPTPVGDTMSGAELQANALETALRGFPLRNRRGLALGLIALLGMIVPLASLRLGSAATAAVALAAAALCVVALQIAFDHHVLLPAVYPLLALTLNTALVFGVRLRNRSTSRAR